MDFTAAQKISSENPSKAVVLSKIEYKEILTNPAEQLQPFLNKVKANDVAEMYYIEISEKRKNPHICTYTSIQNILHKDHLPSLGNVSLEFWFVQLSSVPNIFTCRDTIGYITTRWYLTKYKKQTTPWELPNDRPQGEAIGFAQFEGRYFYREIPDGFSISENLVTNKRPFALPYPL